MLLGSVVRSKCIELSKSERSAEESLALDAEFARQPLLALWVLVLGRIGVWGTTLTLRCKRLLLNDLKVVLGSACQEFTIVDKWIQKHAN